VSIIYFYLLVSTFSIGVFLATFNSFTFPTIIWFLVMALFSALCFKREEKHTASFSVWLALSLLFFGVALGALRMEMAKANFGHSNLVDKVGEKVILEGRVNKEPEKRENNTHIYLETKDGTVLLGVDRFEEVYFGEFLKVSGFLREPEAFSTDFGRVFDYRGYLLAKGVEYQIFSAEILEREAVTNFSFLGTLYKFKNNFTNRLEAFIPEPEVGLGEGLLLGIKQALGTELETAFRKTGIVHMVVLSGYNVMLVVAFVMVFFKRINIVWLKTILGVGAILTFAFLVGLSATVVRASLMASLLLIVQAFNRQYLVLRSLFLVGVLMLIHNPYILVFDVGFQLSFLATLGLILVMPVLQNWFDFLPAKFGLRDLALATIATEIAVLPILLYQIGELSLVAVLVNTLVLPMVPVAMFLTFSTGIVSFLSLKLAWLISLFTFWPLHFINQTALRFANLSFSAVVFPTFPFYLVLIFYVFFGIGLFKIYQKHNFAFGLGDLAQNFLENKNQNKNSLEKEEKNNFEFKDWIIEEEKDEIWEREK